MLSARAYGDFSLEYVEALVRNAHEKAVHRILPIEAQTKVSELIEKHGLIDKYNQGAPKGFKIKGSKK